MPRATWPHSSMLLISEMKVGTQLLSRTTNELGELLWIHTDRLGSVVAMTDLKGMLKVSHGYDAWGKRRAIHGDTNLAVTRNPADVRGFTGHEMLDELDLVHMNGRVYDPLVARFMSADPIIQDPYNGQNYSRYTYVFNNPTNYTDPTGFLSYSGGKCPSGRDGCVVVYQSPVAGNSPFSIDDKTENGSTVVSPLKSAPASLQLSTLRNRAIRMAGVTLLLASVSFSRIQWHVRQSALE